MRNSISPSVCPNTLAPYTTMLPQSSQGPLKLERIVYCVKHSRSFCVCVLDETRTRNVKVNLLQDAFRDPGSTLWGGPVRARNVGQLFTQTWQKKHVYYMCIIKIKTLFLELLPCSALFLHWCSQTPHHCLTCPCVTLSQRLQIAYPVIRPVLPVDSPGPACPLAANGWRVPPVRPQLMQQPGWVCLTSQSQLQSCIIEEPFLPSKIGQFCFSQVARIKFRAPPTLSFPSFTSSFFVFR